jgi:hypothetical protein
MLEPINKENNEMEIDEDESEEVVTKINKNSVINGIKYQNIDEDEEEEDESYYKLDKNNNNLNKINNDDQKSKNNLTLQSFKFEDFLIKFSK